MAVRFNKWTSGNVEIRQMLFDEQGDVCHGHGHNFDHTSYVLKGRILIERLDGPEFDTVTHAKLTPNVVRSVIRSAEDEYNWVLIEAGVYHRLTALEPNCRAHCLFSHRNPDGSVVPEKNGWEKAYD